MENDWTLYVAVREDLKSMNHGKGLAHSGHAAMQCAFEGMAHFAEEYKEYISQTNHGFGTQINLSIPYEDWFQLLQDGVTFLPNPRMAGVICDPTYPYIVDKEMYELIPETIHTSSPVDIGKVKVLCTRSERTAIWFFARKSDPFVKQYLKKYKLAK